MKYRPNDDEAAAALTVAKRRVSLNSNQSALPGHDPFRDPEKQAERLTNDYLAILAEIAVARILNRCWTGCGIGPLGEFDVGGMIQVRATGNDAYGLIVKETDKDGEPYVLVCVDKETRVCRVAGWQWSHAVKKEGKPRHEGTPKLCWILPQERLNSIASLEAFIRRAEWVNDYERQERKQNGEGTGRQSQQERQAGG